jgi:hypothetical protein
MKKFKQLYAVNNQEDEDSSAYPLYPATKDICEKEKSKRERSRKTGLEIMDSRQSPDKEPAHTSQAQKSSDQFIKTI